MANVPDRFVELCNAVICADDNAIISESIRLLINNTEALFPQNDNCCNIQDDFTSFYEEAKSLYNKIYNACDKNDKVTALMAATSIQSDIASTLGRKAYKDIGFTDIVATFHCESFYDYKNIVTQHEQHFIQFLHKHNIKINQFNTFNDFRNNFIESEETI